MSKKILFILFISFLAFPQNSKKALSNDSFNTLSKNVNNLSNNLDKTKDTNLGTENITNSKETFPNSSGQIDSLPYFNLSVKNPSSGKEVALSLRLLMLLSILSLAPSIIILMTSFLRIFMVFDFVRRALSLQSMPPTQILSGIALFLTIFIMWDTGNQIYKDAYVPLQEGSINLQTALKKGEAPLRSFMFRQINSYKNIKMFMYMAKLPKPKTRADIPTYVLIPAYALSEISTAFMMGVLIFVPFIIIDIVVASVLMSMGMIMLPPVTISLPFKIILFILVDGWNLLTEQLVRSFLN